MFASAQLATISIKRIIFHDIPKNMKGGTAVPTLADAESTLDSRRESILRDRLVRVMGSSSAYPIKFSDTSTSIVPDQITNYTANKHNSAAFVQMSRKLARHLFEVQDGSMSAGLLCVIELSIAGLPALGIMKLDREKGAELQWQGGQGSRVVQMSVLDNLVLTEGTRLFKSALFARKASDSFEAAACDTQHSVYATHELAQFWLHFLGCKVTEEPRVSTQRWFDTTIEYINSAPIDAVRKTALYEHVVSELNSNRTTVSAKRFADDYIAVDDREEYLKHVKSNDIPVHQFRKDIQDIKSKLQRTSYHTDQGVTVTAPADKSNLIDVTNKKITVNDRLNRVVSK